MNAAYLTPAITLFNEDGTLDLASQERLFDNLIDQGVDGILVEGSSSEFFAMPMNQRREMAKFAIEKIDHRVKLIIGTSHMVADEIISFSNFCLDAGADAVMILPPYYFHFGPSALLQHYDRLAEQIHGDIYIYNFPDNTGYTIRRDGAGFGQDAPQHRGHERHRSRHGPHPGAHQGRQVPDPPVRDLLRL